MHSRRRGFTIVEILIALTIIGIALVILITNLAGMKSGDTSARAREMIYMDLLFMRSRSASTNMNHRLNFTANNSWRIESQDPTTLAWSTVETDRTFATNTSLTGSTFTNAGTNLTATPRGIFTFSNGAIGTPYITISTLGDSTTKSIYVYVGGAIELRSP